MPNDIQLFQPDILISQWIGPPTEEPEYLMSIK